LAIFLCAHARADEQAQVAAAFQRFIEAANAHDLDAIDALVLDSPQVAWSVNYTDAQGHEGVMRYFKRVFDGNWAAKPDLSRAEWTESGRHLWVLRLSIAIAEGPLGRTAEPIDFDALQSWILTANGWKLVAFVTFGKPAP
jgi:ketosteroid isomerase-like protein